MYSAWLLIKETGRHFMEDEALSRGAAIAYYTVFSIAPVLVIAIAMAGLAFGEQAAEGAIVDQLSDLIGIQGAQGLQAMIASASNPGSGILATVVGIGTLVVAATSVFGEMQSALNAIWKTEAPPHSTLTRMVRARLAGLGLVVTVGFLLLVSLVVSTAIAALNNYLDEFFSGAHLLFQGLSFVISFGLIALLFAAIYKLLPDRHIAWSDVIIGAVATSLLFTIGKSLISLYLGSSSVTHAYGAAGGLVIVLLWIYYSAQIFLFGAEFTRVYAERHGTEKDKPSDRSPEHSR
ncbi:MAG TPA: YihY/virulence factor BrkB family protein [Stellaceae bacterium]|jgi:membrane protein|nr:YihY/virulence factor BrkB family protein [Stellaceae bacterium]